MKVSINDITPEELLRLWTVSKRNDITKQTLADTLGCTFETLHSRLYRARKNSQKDAELGDTRKLFEYNLDEILQLSGDFLIVGDVHSPFTDYDFAQLVSLVAYKHLAKPRKLLVAGDLFDMGNFSKYETVIPAPTWQQERDALEALMREWLEVFDEIYVILGNHDRRMQKLTNGAFDENDLVRLIGVEPDKITSSIYGYCVIDTPMGEYRVTHPANYSQNQLTVAEKLSWKHNQHIISHHEHHVALGWDRYKNHLLVNNGCLADYNKFGYVNLDDNTSASMEQSFVLLKDGYPHVLGKKPPFTNWKLWL